jgi:acetoin utilization deacetylase AcuC-like enzyme
VGFADETGSGRGLGHNINYPMPPRADDDQYIAALEDACERVAAFGPSLLIVSLGLDTYITDPICDLAVTTDGMRRSGDVVRQLGMPTVVLQEGGYDVNALGDNVGAWLTGLGA